MILRKKLIALSICAIIAALSGCDTSDGLNSNTRGTGNQQADPVVVDLPIAFVERPIPVDEDGEFVPADVLDPIAFNPGARLILKDRASVPAGELIITDQAFPLTVDEEDPNNADDDQAILYDVKDLEASSDGLKLIFAMRAPEIPNANDDEQPTWNIWEYDREFEELRRIISSDLLAEEGHDVGPHYLPDGRIVFSSTRQRRSKAILLDENKPQFAALNEDRDNEALLLHVMNDDGTGIEQITFNQSHDLHPTVLANGEILFLRWDNYSNNRDRLSLYTVNPDGTNPHVQYGYHSQNTGTNDTEVAFLQPREMPDGRILVNLRQRSSLRLGGDMVAIDMNNFTEIDQPVTGSDEGPAQVSLAVEPVYTDEAQASPHGYFSSAYALDDETDRLLVSWSPCLIQGYRLGVYINTNFELIGGAGQYVDRDGNNLTDFDTPVVINPDEVGIFPCNEETLTLPEVPESDPLYGLWIYDPVQFSQAPVIIAEEGRMFTDAIVLEPKVQAEHRPAPIVGVDISQELVEQAVGVVHIHSVYDVDGTDISPNGIITTADPAQTPAIQRPARFIRIIKAVSIPDDDVFDFDFNSAAGAGNVPFKDILGYVPVEPDGSVMFKVPADVAFSMSILDESGKRISPRHQNWLTVRPGEVKECKGCHTQQSTQPHGRPDAELPSVNSGALAAIPFPNTQLLDEFDTPHPAPEVGETMAAYYARVNGSTEFPEEGARTPSMNIVFEDEWTDESGGLTKDASYDLSYADLVSGAAPVTSSACLTNWNSLCRTVINYEEHIQPIWDAGRLVLDPNDSSLILADNTCTSCHSSVDALGAAKIPDGNRQLDLTGGPSDINVDYVNSYPELFNADDVVELNENGILQPELIQLIVNGEPQFEALDADGNPVTAPIDTDLTLVLDDDGQPIPVMIASGRQVQGILSPNGAIASQTFFNVFEVGDGTVDHRNFLNGAELKLIAEWLDIGGQYYNNPFDAPPN